MILGAAVGSWLWVEPSWLHLRLKIFPVAMARKAHLFFVAGPELHAGLKLGTLWTP